MRTYAEAHAWPAHGGPLVERDNMRIRLNYETTENGNVYGDDVQRITGIYCPITGNDSLIFTRTTQYKIVPKRQGAGGVAVDVGFSGGSAAPRSPVNNCGKLTGGDVPVMTPTPSEHAAAVLNLVDGGGYRMG